MSHNYSKSDQALPSCCATASAELKLYEAFVFSIPVFLIFILLFLFYLFYLRRRRVDWSALRMRASVPAGNDISMSELGLKKEHREMLPIIVFKESFSVKDTQCPVCLADYQADDRLQQIPGCGHTFHMNCIDLWLATHTTCPLCRLSLIPPAKASTEPSDSEETNDMHFPTDNGDEISHQIERESCNASCSSQDLSDLTNGDRRILETSSQNEGRLEETQFVDRDRC